MRHYLNLVSISNKVHHRQSRMTRICIVLAVFLVAVMFGLADMYLKSMTDETRHQTGAWHCKITAIDEKTSEYIAARPEIDLSGWQGNIPAEIGCTVADQPVSVAGMDETIFSEIYLGSVLSGEFPEIAGQVAVSSTLAQTAGISLGDTLTLNSPDGSTMQLAITGIMEDDAANMISGSASAILLTPEGLSNIQTADLSGNWQSFGSRCSLMLVPALLIFSSKTAYLMHKSPKMKNCSVCSGSCRVPICRRYTQWHFCFLWW